jgi:hypothetical protein
MKLFIRLVVLACMLGFASGQTFELTSPDIHGQITNDQVFSGFGCEGKNISPRLEWKNAPEGTKSFAVTVYDPDAPTGGGWWHWLIFDIPPEVNALARDAGNLEAGMAPAGSVQSITSFGKPGFGGSCPPVGDRPHAYIFTVYALTLESLGLDETATPSLVGYYLNQNLLAKASLIAYYSR